MSPIERDLLQSLYDELSSFLLDNVADDEAWEDAFPQLDELRTHIGDLLLEKDK
jgi:hypothetical protein